MEAHYEIFRHLKSYLITFCLETVVRFRRQERITPFLKAQYSDIVQNATCGPVNGRSFYESEILL